MGLKRFSFFPLPAALRRTYSGESAEPTGAGRRDRRDFGMQKKAKQSAEGGG